MSVFEAADFDHHETVAFFDDKTTGLHAIIAIHSTALGPACGGTRMYAYTNGDEALNDVLRLSRGMSYKSAIAGLPLGGGKAVIIGDPGKDKTEARLLAYAEAVNALGGRYITAMDVGIGPNDLPVIARNTKYVAGFDQPGKTGGDSGPLTALGVFVGLKAAVKHRLGADGTKGLSVAIQGLGKVGMGLARQLHGEGAKLIVSDVNADAVRSAEEAFGAKAVSPEEIAAVECDVFSPNALGAILNDRSIAQMQAKIVAGAANNQLARDEHGVALKQRGILYAPDYVINGGGIIRVAGQIFGWADAEIEHRVLGIGDTLTQIFRRADGEGVPTNVVADRMAEERMAAGPHASARAAE
ncbi:MAG TPA: Glu/Leu/Phe/Val dehydrogenase dimerization domain-containing protein [Rhizomicrobium sp.]|jgi:leucine dehydrogenase|nr:Glu/Leu/Phe/Val dehydrogenase dimerization domain-containing protein [Rhizomicrobium sp.]